jgi:hypothetical protein
MTEQRAQEDDDALIMRFLLAAGMDSKQIKAVTYASWKDGIGIEKPSPALVSFVRLIRLHEQRMADLRDERSVDGESEILREQR